VGASVGGGELLRGDVRVDLRGAEARVAEHLLHGAQIRPAVEQMRRGRVPQRVGPTVSRPTAGASARDDVISGTRAESSTACADEQRAGPRPRSTSPAAADEVVLDRGRRRPP
jgi:hypothetical protein